MLLDLGLALGKVRGIFTKMLTFGGTDEYGELPEAWVSTDGNWTVEIVASGLSSFISGIVLHGDSDGVKLQKIGNGRIELGTKHTATLDGATITSGTTVFPTDNKLHTFVLTGTAQSSVNLIGAASGTYFNGIIKSVKLTDLSTPANSREYRLNSGNTLYELPQGESLGSELITNGTFDTDLSGWAANRGASISLVNNEMKVTLPNTTNFAGAYYTLTTTVGSTYFVSANMTEANGHSSGIYKSDSSTSHSNVVSELSSTAGVLNLTFTATATTTYIWLSDGTDTAGAFTLSFDDVSVKEIPKALLYNNVVAGDWGNYYFDSSLGTNGGWVSKTELVTNGGFDTDSDWVKGGGWTISGGVASIDGTAGSIYQPLDLPIKSYLFKFTVVVKNSGAFVPMVNGTTGTARGSVGTYTEIITPASAIGNTGIAFGANNGSIDNVSVREIILL